MRKVDAVSAKRTAIDLRTLVFIDILQPQLAGFMETVARGFLPLEEQAALYIEIAPGLMINRLTDIALKRTAAIPGMQIVERNYGLLELHHFDQGQVRAAAAAVLGELGRAESDRLRPRVCATEVITGIDNHQSAMINRMRHGDMLRREETLWNLEVHPAAYAAIAANEAEKAAPIRLLEVITFGAFGRLWLGGKEAEIDEASRAALAALAAIDGRDNPA
jgi:hypothetical protein